MESVWFEARIDAETSKNYVKKTSPGPVESGVLRASSDGQPCQSPPQREDAPSCCGPKAQRRCGAEDDEVDHRTGRNDGRGIRGSSLIPGRAKLQKQDIIG